MERTSFRCFPSQPRTNKRNEFPCYDTWLKFYERSTHREKETSMDLNSRVELLERRCRRLTVALFAVVTIAIAGAFVNANQATTQPTVRRAT